MMVKHLFNLTGLCDLY